MLPLKRLKDRQTPSLSEPSAVGQRADEETPGEVIGTTHNVKIDWAYRFPANLVLDFDRKAEIQKFKNWIPPYQVREQVKSSPEWQQ